MLRFMVKIILSKKLIAKGILSNIFKLIIVVSPKISKLRVYFEFLSRVYFGIRLEIIIVPQLFDG